MNTGAFAERIGRLIEGRLAAGTTRRSFLRKLGGVLAAFLLGGMSRRAEALSFAEFFQKHYRELTPEEKKKIFARIEGETKRKFGVEVDVGDPPPLPGVKFVYALDLSRCNGSRYCVRACQEENNQDPSFSYIKVLELNNGTFNLESAERYYEGTIPKKDKFYLPVQCQHCEQPPCVKACPVKATWKEADGIVVVDYDWCIGCRYCQAACPYEARYFNFKEPEPEAEKINPDQAYLSNRIRSRGVMEKCTFCLQRTRKGRYPACLEACPTGARKFGNILDPESEISQILRKKNVFVLKEDMNTSPQFFYFFS